MGRGVDRRGGDRQVIDAWAVKYMCYVSLTGWHALAHAGVCFVGMRSDPP